ncbi:MAG: tetratricopeptide repeat protein [Candidatus Heimdallarchaeota archaeon]|nr:tetratricopeptide repeat protein [Candidatus Heimdallarchaeota archaeon]
MLINEENYKKIKSMIYSGKIDEAKAMIGSFDKSPDTMILVIHITHDLGEFAEQISLAKDLLNSESLTINQRLEALYLQAWGHHRKGTLEKAFSIANEGLSLLETLSAEEREHVMEQECLLMKALGSLEMERGNLDITLKYRERGLELAEKSGDKYLIAQAINSRATLSYYIGDYKIALEMFKQSFEISVDLNYPFGQLIAAVNCGEIYRRIGKYTDAIEYLNLNLSLSQRFNNSYGLGYGYWTLGKVYTNTGDYALAKEMLTNAINLWGSLGNSLHLANSLFALGKLRMKWQKKIDFELQSLRELSIKENNPIISQAYILLQGLKLKLSPKLIDKGKSMELLQSIVQDTLIYFEFTYDASIHYCDLLLQEFMISNHHDSFDEAQGIVDTLLILTKDQNATVKIIEVLMLKSKLLMINGDMDEAGSVLNEAMSLSMQNNLDNYITQVKVEIKKLEVEIKNMTDKYDKHKSILEKMDNSKIFDYLQLLIQEEVT